MRSSRLTAVVAFVVLVSATYLSLVSRPVTQAQGPARPGGASSRVMLRLTFLAGREPVRWDGSVRVSSGRVAEITGWRIAAGDQVEGTTGWKASTLRYAPAGAAAAQNQQNWPVASNGVFLALEGVDDTTLVSIETAQGNFDFTIGQVPYGTQFQALKNQVVVERTALSTRLTTGPEEEDFPAAAVAPDGAVWVAYVQFVHNAEYQSRPRQMAEPPASFDFLSAPVGGDQVFVQRYSDGRWSEPMPASEKGRDVYKAAVAVDGRNRVWVFWSDQVSGNFDIYARPLDNGKWGKPIRLTAAPEPDLIPAAATDTSGRVWVAWQGFRNGYADILAARQTPAGDAFSPEIVIDAGTANDWDPAIAASPSGGVAIAWDTYRKGDYDVYYRTVSPEGKPGPEVLVAGSLMAEMRPAVAYDKDNRLWVAWEEATERFGKNWGAYDTWGTSLYHYRQVHVKAFQGQKPFTTSQDLEQVLPGAPVGPRGGRRAESGAKTPNPELVKQRPPSGTPAWPPRPLNNFPRLAADAAGRVWLAFRTVDYTGRSPLGTVWYECAAYFDGARWQGPIFIPNSDNYMDNRPALASPAAGRLLLIGSADRRGAVLAGVARAAGAGPGAGAARKGAAAKAAKAPALPPAEALQNDLYVAELSATGPVQPAQLKPVAAEQPAKPEAASAAENAAVKRLRSYQATVGGKTLRLMRGEFHRHTEVSGDGGRDGPLIEAWRYGLDMAAMDWIGCCDHDNGGGREYSWWITQKQTDAFRVGTRFVPLFSYERSVNYPEGHRNVLFAQRGIRPLGRMPLSDENSPGHAPDTVMLYKYLKQFDGVCASHTSGTNMGTDWRDNDPILEPVVEIYQGDRQNYEMPDAPRSNNANDSIGGWRPKGFVSLALLMGYRLGFQASSDHISTHMSYCNIYTEKPTREAMMDAFRKRHVYGATDNILADVRSGTHFMGDEFETAQAPVLEVKLVGSAPFAKVQIVKDNQYVYTAQPNKAEVQFSWQDNAPAPGKTSYYYVRGEQQNGELVWVSPMWIKYTGK